MSNVIQICSNCEERCSGTYCKDCNTAQKRSEMAKQNEAILVEGRRLEVLRIEEEKRLEEKKLKQK